MTKRVLRGEGLFGGGEAQVRGLLGRKAARGSRIDWNPRWTR